MARKRHTAAPTAPALLADLEAARAAVFGTGYEDPGFVDLDTVRAYLEPLIGSPERAQQFERLLTSLDAHDLLVVEPALAQLEVPTLVVWGTADEFFDLYWAYWLRDMIPGVRRVVEIPGAKVFFPTSGRTSWRRCSPGTGRRRGRPRDDNADVGAHSDQPIEPRSARSSEPWSVVS